MVLRRDETVFFLPNHSAPAVHLNIVNKMAFQSKTNRPLANSFIGYIVNKFDQVRGDSQVNKFEQDRPVDRLTNRPD